MKVPSLQITVGRISVCEGLIRSSLATLGVFNEVSQQLSCLFPPHTDNMPGKGRESPGPQKHNHHTFTGSEPGRDQD